MTRSLILLTTMVMGCMFMFFPVTEPRDFFIYSGITVSFDTWFYFFMEKVIVLLLSVVILHLTQDLADFTGQVEYIFTAKVFVFIQMIEIGDYILFYGEPWSPYLPSWNNLKVFLLALAITYERKLEKRHGERCL